MLIEKSYQKNKSKYLYVLIAIAIVGVISLSFYAFNNAEKFSREYYVATFPKMLDQYEAEKKEVDHASIMAAALAHTAKGYVGAFDNTKPESININIKFKHLEKIKAKRQEVLNDTIFLFASDDDYVPAVVEHRNRKIKVKLRLKGDGNDHLKDESKWSFRIKTRKGDQFLGMRKFSIQHPKTRGYTYEPIFHKTMSDLGVISLRYDFINVSINGEPIGIMALEEHFSKELLENQRYKESLIYKASEDKYWEYFLQQVYFKRTRKASGMKPWPNSNLDNVRRAYTNALNVPFDVYGKGKIDKSEYLSGQNRVGSGMLRGMVHGQLLPSEVFDVENTGKMAAGLWFWESHHPSNVVNARYYLNPYTQKFETIAFDANAQEKWSFDTIYRQKHGRQLMQLIMSDEKIYESFQREAKALYEKVQNGYFDALKAESDGYRIKLASEFPLIPRINFEGIEKRINKSYPKIVDGTYFKKLKKRQKDIYFPPDFELPGVLNAYITDSTDGVSVEFENILLDSVEITELAISVDGKTIDIAEISDIKLPIVLPPTQRDNAATTVSFPLSSVSAKDKIAVTGQASPSRQKTSYAFEGRRYFPKLNAHPLQPSDMAKLKAEYPFISINSDKKEVIFDKGEWTISGVWIFPYGYSATMSPGTTISFDKNSGLIFHGGSNFLGTEQEPIVLKSIGEGKSASWSGLTFLEGEDSEWANVKVFNTNFNTFNTWTLTGAITFYKTNIKLENVSFTETVAEDALNIVHSQFLMDNVTIDGSRSDGFDGDFTKGTIINSQFKNIGGDGIDFSGSDIEVSDSTFSNVYDKALSAGESTRLQASAVLVRDSGTGVASKDRSYVVIENSEFINIKYSVLMSYMKKPEYGGSVLTATNLKFEQSPLAVVAQKKSKLILNGTSIKPINIDIEKLYDEGYMKK